MMGFFGKSKSSQPEKTHPALRLKAEIDKDAGSRPTTLNYPGELDRLNTDKVEALVHFLDDKPLATCFEHRGSSACLGYSATPFGTLLRADSAEPFSDDCPLCRSGDKPEFYSVYNVVVMAQSQGPKFSASAIIMGETRPFRRPTLKLWFDPGVGSLYGTINQARKQYGKLNDPDVYCWVTKNGVYPMTADHMAGEEWRTQPLTWAERHELSSAKWSNESVPNALDILPRMTLRRPDRRT